MGTESNIGWTRHTWNPFRGCVEESEACDHCYAREMAKRNPKTLGQWGDDTVRVVAADAYWNLPFRWDREAASAGERHRVFSLSMGDWLEEHHGPVHDVKGNRLYRQVDVNASAVDGSVGTTLDDVRTRMLDVIRKTPNLDYLLLTKRPQNWRKCLEAARSRIARDYRERDALTAWIDAWLGGESPSNVWAGVTAENQRWADERIPELLEIPAAVRFLSLEPLLGPVDLSAWIGDYYCPRCREHARYPADNRHCPNCGHEGDWDDNCDPCPDCGVIVETEMICPRCGVDGGNGGLDFNECWDEHPCIHWAIVGGESGPKRRPMEIAWLEDVVEQCRSAGVAVYIKQDMGPRPGMQGRIEDSLWRIKEFPSVPAPLEV